ncbi:VanZ family protein [Bacillus salinus]|uniref:VanZ family protein n=1 Tax=Bacillus sp. HMF5848 TaxID=2495421 RepID=UPI00163A0DC5|nr:VanZ family protein [Bacillus sp. HMF5848]
MKLSKIHKTLFVLYALCLVYLMFLSDVRTAGGYYSYNIVPFATIKNYFINFRYFNIDTWIINIVGNVIVFVPFGLFLPLMNKRLRKPILFIVVFIAIITSLEMLQFIFAVGSFDVDDILLNTIGAVIGLFITYRNKGTKS